MYLFLFGMRWRDRTIIGKKKAFEIETKWRLKYFQALGVSSVGTARLVKATYVRNLPGPAPSSKESWQSASPGDPGVVEGVSSHEKMPSPLGRAKAFT